MKQGAAVRCDFISLQTLFCIKKIGASKYIACSDVVETKRIELSTLRMRTVRSPS